MEKPGEAHQKLAQLAGNWRGEEKMHPSPWDPKGGIAIATLNNRMALAGFTLIGDYTQSRDGKITFEGHAVWVYDSEQSEYRLHWFDSLGGGLELFKGRLMGQTLTVTSEGPQGFARLIYRFEGEGRMSTRMEMSADGADWKPMFDGTYDRISL
jgi:hypothetical protein